MNTYQILSKLYEEKQAFQEDLRPKYITPSLIKYEVITHKEEQEVLSQVKPSQQVEKLMAILTTKSSNELKYFVKALKEDEEGGSTYPWLAKKLESSYTLSDQVNTLLTNGNIPFPVNYLLEREDKLKSIRDALKKAADEKRHWVVLFGPIGSGKSSLAAEAIRDNAIIETYFPDGVYWIQLGNLRDEDAIKSKLKKMFKLIDYQNELLPNEGVYDLSFTLRKEIRKKPRVLIILDDVWCPEIIKAFDVGCPILVTTKNTRTLDKVYSFCNFVECKYDLSHAEISCLLSKYVKCEPYQLPKVVSAISTKCKGSPLITCLIGSIMVQYGNEPKMWENVNSRLEERGTDTLRRRFNSGDSDSDLSKIINMCLEPIEQIKNNFLDFLIFVKDIPVPSDVLEILWELKDYEVWDIMFELSCRCFVQVEHSTDDDDSYSYTSHDLYLDTLRAETDSIEIKSRHKKLVEKILKISTLSDGRIDLSLLPKSYIPYSIGYHLYHAGEVETLEKLYLDLKFVEQKIHLTDDVMDIMLDYRIYRDCFQNEKHVEMFESFITRNAVPLTQKKCDIIQLALFESVDSIVYGKAKELALKAPGIYYDWCNKEENNPHLYNYNIKHTFEVFQFSSAVFNCDGSLVASVGGNFAVIWNSLTGVELQELYGHTDVINYCVFNNRGDRFLTASADTTVRIFPIGESLSTSGNYTKKRTSLVGSLNQVRDIDMSILIFTEHENEVVCCAYSPDDSYIISSDITGVTRIWRVAHEGEDHLWINKHTVYHKHPKHCFSCCCFSSDGLTFGTAVYDTIKLWDFETGHLRATFSHSSYLVKKFCFSNDDRFIVSVSDNIVSKWDVISQERSTMITGRNKDHVICSFCLSGDGQYIACGTSSAYVIVINMTSQLIIDKLRGHRNDVINVMFSKDGRKLLSVSSNRYIIHDMMSVEDTPLISYEGNLGVSMNGDNIMTASSNYFNSLQVRKGFEGKLMVSSDPEEDDISACSLSNDCTVVVYGTTAGIVKVFNLTAMNNDELLAHSGKINYILHSKNDSTFFTCSEDKTIKIWRSTDDSLTLRGHSQSVLMCTEFKSSNRLLSCSKDGSLRVWDTSSGGLLFPITEGHGNQDIRFCDISPHEDYLASASADGTIKVWNSTNGERVKTFRLPKDERNTCVKSCRFSPSSKILISGHDNGKVILWHLEGKQKFFVLSPDSESPVSSLHFTVNGSQLLSMSNCIKLWDFSKNFSKPSHTIILPSSYMGVDPPNIWTSGHFGEIVVILNSVLYIMKIIK